MHTFVQKKEMRCYNILLDCIRIESTDGNFGTHEKEAIAIPIVICLPIPVPIHISSGHIRVGL